MLVYTLYQLETYTERTINMAIEIDRQLFLQGLEKALVEKDRAFKLGSDLAQQGINIEDMETTTAPAPMSGTLLFTMNATVLVPPNLVFHKWSDALDEIGDKLNVSIKVAVVK